VADLRAEPPNPSDSSKPNKAINRHLGVLWLKDGDFARPIEVKVGISDGANTAISSELLHDGQEVVTGEIAESAQAGTKNPFLPVFRRR
jgi:HlyD family secretion protein